MRDGLTHLEIQERMRRTLLALVATQNTLNQHVRTTDLATGGVLADVNAALALADDLAGRANVDFMGVVQPQDFGGVGNGVADDTVAVQAAVVSAIATGRPLVIPAGTWLVSNTILIATVDGFRLDMIGRLKRAANSPRVAMLVLQDCTNFRATAILTDGNVANNMFEGYPVDEAKHDIRIQNCKDVVIDLIDSVNPAGDTLYIQGGDGNLTERVQISSVKSVSDGYTGRNAVSIIKGKNLQIGKILSINTGYNGSTAPVRIPMPGGLDIEPNTVTDIIDNVSVDSVIVRTAGSAGFSLYSAYGKIITHVSVGKVTVQKLAGVLGSANVGSIRGVNHVQVGSVSTDGLNVAQGFVIMDANDVVIDLRLQDSAGTGLAIGATTSLTNFKISGTILNCLGHGIVIYNADNGEIDMAVHHHGDGYAALSKNTGGTSYRIRFRGDWTKDTTGSWLVNMAAAASYWILDAVRADGWGVDTRLAGAFASTVETRNCPGINFGTAAPTFDGWKAGTTVWNTAPATGAPLGWVCTVAGTPGTWKAMANLA